MANALVVGVAALVVGALVGGAVGVGGAIAFGWVKGFKLSPQIGPVYLSPLTRPPTPGVHLGQGATGQLEVGANESYNVTLVTDGLAGVEFRLSWENPPDLRYRLSLNVTPRDERLGGRLSIANESGNLTLALATANATGAPLAPGEQSWDVEVWFETARVDGPSLAPQLAPPDALPPAEWRQETALVPLGAAFSVLPHVAPGVSLEDLPVASPEENESEQEGFSMSAPSSTWVGVATLGVVLVAAGGYWGVQRWRGR